MDIVTGITIASGVVTAASLTLQGLAAAAKLTKTTRDDTVIAKALAGTNFLGKALHFLSMNLRPK